MKPSFFSRTMPLLSMMFGIVFFASSCTDPNAPPVRTNKLFINDKLISTTDITAQYYKSMSKQEMILLNFGFLTWDTTQVPKVTMPKNSWVGIQFALKCDLKPGIYTLRRSVDYYNYELFVTNRTVSEDGTIMSGNFLGTDSYLSHAGNNSQIIMRIEGNTYGMFLGKPGGRITGTFSAQMRENYIPFESIRFPSMRVMGEFNLPIE